MHYLVIVSACVFFLGIYHASGQCATSDCGDSFENPDKCCANNLLDDVQLLHTVYLILANAMKRTEGSLPSASQQSTVNCPKPKVCPSEFDYLPDVDGCYKVVFQSMNWSRSGEVCRRVMPGVHLAAITSAAEQNAIENYLQQEFNKSESSACLKTLWINGGKSVWLSGQTRDPNRCGTPYVWKTLEAVEIPFNYTNWLQREPNCENNNENCAHIAAGRDYTWNDSSCDRLSCALCEY